MKKRYAITIDDLAMRQVKVEAARSGLTVGDWITSNLSQFNQDVVAWTQDPKARREFDKAYKEASMDDIAKKAIEPDKVKPDGRGQLRKGLGDLPGESHEPKPTVQRDPSFGHSRPAPKPGK